MIRTGLIAVIIAVLLGSPVGARPAEESPTVFFGVIPRYNPMIMYFSYQPIMDYLTENTPYRFELKLSRDYSDAVRMLKEGETQVTSLGDVTFVEAQQGFGAVPILKPLNSKGEPFYTSIIIVREDSPIETVKDLKGKDFAFSSYHSTSGNLIPRYYLFRHGVSLFDFGSYINLDSHDAVAKAVLKGKVDAGAVKDVVAYRHKEHGLRYLAVSEPIPSVPIVVRRNAPPEFIAHIKRALLAIDPADPAQRKRMEKWDPEFRNGFVEADEGDYDSIYRMMKAIPEGCGIRCH